MTNTTEITDLSDDALDVLLDVKSGADCVVVSHLSREDRAAVCRALGVMVPPSWRSRYAPAHGERALISTCRPRSARSGGVDHRQPMCAAVARIGRTNASRVPERMFSDPGSTCKSRANRSHVSGTARMCGLTARIAQFNCMQVACQLSFRFMLTKPRTDARLYLMTNTNTEATTTPAVVLEANTAGAELLYHAIASNQQAGNVCALVSMPEPDMARLAEVGCDLADLLVSCPETAAQAVEITDTLLRTGALGVIVVVADLSGPARKKLIELARPSRTALVIVLPR